MNIKSAAPKFKQTFDGMYCSLNTNAFVAQDKT
jgi:hypothetical protein